MKTYNQLKEEIANTAGSGQFAGLGVGPEGEPGKKIKRTQFAGLDVFDVDNDVFHRCKLGKIKYKHWKSFVGMETAGQEIREFASSNPRKPIILRSKNGTMLFVRGSHLDFNKGK